MADGTILCVDDDRNVLRSLKNQLKRRFKGRMSVETAENVAEALEVLDELEADGFLTGRLVVISDWLMPGEKGDTLLVEVARRYPGAVAILLTGQADATAKQRVRSEANASSLEKPWVEDQLGEIIETGLSQG